MIATETIVPRLKIKFSTKRIEVDPASTKCELGQKVSPIYESGDCDLKGKPSVMGSNKRGLPGNVEGQKEKRQKMDRKLSHQCAIILKSITAHRFGWVFSKPVDPVALNIPDYFTIISEPMDLGTVKSKLDKNLYSGLEEFAADVRLTFSNAMTYNPPGNDVHKMANDLSNIFERKLKDYEKKWKSEEEHGKSTVGAIKETMRKSCNGMHSLQNDILPKKLQLSEPKGLQKCGSLAARDAKVEVPKSTQIPRKLVVKDLHKGNNDNSDRGHPSGSIKACPSMGLVTRKCRICCDVICHCVIHSDSTLASSDISSEGSEGKNLHSCGADALRPGKCTTPSPRKSDPNSDGSLDSEHMCSATSPATYGASGEAWSTTVFDVQLSPKKALRAAMLKSRFADTILKAQQKTLLDHGDKANPAKLQQEKERLERMQREEKARIEAQIKAAEAAARMKAAGESKQQREKEREAARAAIQQMERTVEIEHNLEILKELEMLSGCKLSYQVLSRKNGSKKAAMKAFNKSQNESPLERLGLFIKDEYVADEDEEAMISGWEEGEIFS
ncbi:hypothetical protein L6164_031784 [Bauhinia variegata]|uniref:Uncharacterized protein n=1 Tax=Bauhinia variegata TaxID=167791 RepID=A0ACB9KLF5_BAUVA|nr:hypothetical protein L6164_031784 [Bauhinia variegata]